MERRREVSRLFDLTRDMLLTTEQDNALTAIANQVARRFKLDVVAICTPHADGGWNVHHGGDHAPPLDPSELSRASSRAQRGLEFDARSRAYAGHGAMPAVTNMRLAVTPIRLGARPIALLVTGGAEMEAGTRDALAGIVAIALERNQLLAERRGSELARQRADLSSALLASLSHDLRTPLTAIRTAVTNLHSSSADPTLRRDQADVAMEQIDRLQKLFEEILDMARIESHSVQAERRWVVPADVVDAAIAYAGPSLDRHHIRIDADQASAVDADPRLTASALAHLLENAAAYSPPGSAIEIRAWTDREGIQIVVRDHGSGLAPEDIDHLFEPFFRGPKARQRAAGTGMGLAITRGLLTAQGGRVWGENTPGGGAQFSIAVPGRVRAVTVQDV
jgi:two-component system sensor histidine kinase KdpD